MIVSLMGSAYKFSKRAWKNFLEKWLELGDMPDIERFATRLGDIKHNITDLGIVDIQDMLEEIK